ncbi:MAG TPA: NfeD family protein [Acidimicrobiales bacterium]|nr:NfeD family protein [Acidimicrobiales bacterium]
MNKRAVEQNWETSIRTGRLVLACLTLGAALVAVLIGAPAPSFASAPARTTRIDVVEISGLVDRVQADFLERALRDAAAHRAAVLVVRLDSRDAVVSTADMGRLVTEVRSSPVPVAVWVGPGREARATGGAARIWSAAGLRGVAPGARVGGGNGLPVATVDGRAEAATLGDFIVGLDGQMPTGGTTAVHIPTTVVERPGRPPQRQLAPEAEVRFASPSLLAELLHGVSTPSAAYLLLVVGLLLLVFEFFTGGIGVAASVGVLALVLAGYGLGALPTRPLGLALVAAGVAGFAVDVQAGAPRFWSAAGTVLFTAGSFFLFAGMGVPLLVLVAVLGGLIAFMVAAMPGVIRTRYSTPTIGRESMLGELGEAVSDVDPDGVVTVRGAPWRARTNRATPIRRGEAVRVAAIDGLLLEVEPLEGAARDAGH